MALPGVNTVILDKFTTFSRRDVPVGPRIAIIGTRNTASGTDDGTGLETLDVDPYYAIREDRVIAAFGAESQLHRGYLEAVAGGAQRVVLIPLPEDTAFNQSAGTLSSDSYGESPFDDAFSAAEAIRADIIVLWGAGVDYDAYNDLATPSTVDQLGFYADNAQGTTSWAYQAAEKCATITTESHPCFAVLGLKPWTSTATSDGGMTPADVATHLAFSNLPNRQTTMQDGNGNNIGVFVSIVAGEIEPVGYNDTYRMGFSNGAAMYAGAISQLDPWSSPTNKVIFNVSKLRYNPTKTQQEALIDKGLVPIALNYTRNPVWVDAQTFGKDTSDYIRLTTLRITFDTVLMVRQTTGQFIGEGASLAVRNAIETAVTSGLRGMQQLGALLASDFSISYIPSENKAIVDLVITPAFEIRNIEVSVSVQL